MKLFKTTSLRQLLQKEPSELSLGSFFTKEEDEDTWYDSASTLDLHQSSSSSLSLQHSEEEEEASVVTTSTTATATSTLSSCVKQGESTTIRRLHRRRGKKQHQGRRRVRLDTINVVIHKDDRDLTEEEVQAQWSTRAELDEMYHEFRAQGDLLPVQVVESIHALHEGCENDDTAKMNHLVAQLATMVATNDDNVGMARHVAVVQQGLKDRRQKLHQLVLRRQQQQSRKGGMMRHGALRPLRGERLRVRCQAITQQAQCFAQCLAQAQCLAAGA